MSSSHSHVSSSQTNERSLWGALALTGGFLIAEVIAGFYFNSLALLSDAAHMFTDAAALAIALAAVRIAKRPADSKRTYGYHRFEILAAAFNALMLFAVAGYILYEAWQRFNNPAEVQSVGMLVVASLGLIVNLLSMRLLNAGKDKSLNVKGAYLEVWSDMLGSIGVIAAAIIIYFTQWSWVDSLVAVAIGLWVLPRTWILLKETLNILLEGVPEGMNLDEVVAVIRKVPGVIDIHDVHLWAITSGKNSFSAHVVHAPAISGSDVTTTIRETLAETFDIDHCTIQCEIVSCGHAECFL
jgi:cobalt-zinc-cadmium efflux system protein